MLNFEAVRDRERLATLGHLAAGHYLDAGEPVVLLGDVDKRDAPG